MRRSGQTGGYAGLTSAGFLRRKEGLRLAAALSGPANTGWRQGWSAHAAQRDAFSYLRDEAR
jgi:hypothetical protein